MGLFRRARPIDPANLERCKTDLASLQATIEQHGSSTQELAGKLAALDARVTAVSTELANQLTELGHDIDALNARPPANGHDPQLLDGIRDGQVRLANEQARYQIAFREDLSRLAEDLKRFR